MKRRGLLLTVTHVSLMVLISTAGIILALAEGNPLPALTLPLAILATYFVDWQKLVVPSQKLVTGLGIVAFLAAGMEFFSGQIESSLLAGEHLLVYLTWVFLIQPKEQRHYWWLCALGVLQVAVASVLTNGIWFGGALVFYIFLATWTLAVYLLDRSLRAAEEVHGAKEDPTAEKIESGPSRPAAGRRLIWNGLSSSPRPINARFVGSTLVVTCLSLLLSGVFFLFTPRIWMNPLSIFDDAPLAGQPLTGFTEEIRLGDLGEILESNSPVMSVRLLHASDKKPLSRTDSMNYFGSEPLFRGAVLERYEGSHWQRLGEKHLWNAVSYVNEGSILQRVRLRPLGTRTLFAAGNVISASMSPKWGPIQREELSDELVWQDSRSSSTIEYDVMTDMEPPDTYHALRRQRNPRFQQYLNDLLQYPSSLRRVAGLAQQVTAGAETPEEIASQLETYFRDSGEFSYTLKLNISDSRIDPLEDFLINRRTGHCEYFASAMVIMLRTRGVPSRLISGFKGGVYNRRTRTYHVQQLHAHAWVEAYINGRWVTFDPTPALRDQSVQSKEQNQDSLKAMWNNLNERWIFAVRMSRDEQQNMIYEPMRRLAKSSWEWAQTTIKETRIDRKWIWDFIRSPQQWFTLQGAVFWGLIGLIMLLGYWLGRKVTPWLRLLAEKIQQQRRLARRRTQVAFYERFCRILRKHGVRQQPTQTAREFVRDSLHKLEPRLDVHGLTRWPEDLVQKFYRVRFGNEQLTDVEEQQLEARLGELEICLTNGTGKPRETAAT